MAKSRGVVASESPCCWGRRNDVVAVDCRILEKGFIRERKWVSKTFGNNGGWKVNSLFQLWVWVHPWRGSGRFEWGHPWRWIVGGVGPEGSFKGADGSGS